ncbi:ATP-binding cassette domain-containing protein [Nonomuraea longispora]
MATSIVVIKDGRVIETTEPARTSENDLIRLMAGRRLEQIYPGRRSEPGQTRLQVSGLTRTGEFQDVSFTLRAGEIVGMFGLVGSGRSELARCVFGVEPATAGSGAYSSPAEAIAAGLALVTEDRKRTGLVLGMSVRDNIALTTLKGPFIDLAKQRDEIGGMIGRLGIQPVGCAPMVVEHLSGGNQQKAVLAKWLLKGPRVLLLDEPTRGVDMATRVEIYRMIDALAREGVAVLLISSDLTEVIGASDRVLVMAHGRIVGELRSDETSEDEVLAYSMGTPT